MSPFIIAAARGTLDPCPALAGYGRVCVNIEGHGATVTPTPTIITTRQRQDDHEYTNQIHANMPGRASSRSTRTSATSVARKSSTGTLKSTRASSTRASSARQSSNAVEIPDEGDVTSLRTQIAQIFGDAQKTTATQRKLVVNLRKIQEACCFEPPEPKKGGKKGREEIHEDFDEEEFNNEVVRCVLRVLGVKKSEPAGDRIIRFLGLFLKHASEKGATFTTS